jgi:hypothetical protein
MAAAGEVRAILTAADGDASADESPATERGAATAASPVGRPTVTVQARRRHEGSLDSAPLGDAARSTSSTLTMSATTSSSSSPSGRSVPRSVSTSKSHQPKSDGDGGGANAGRSPAATSKPSGVGGAGAGAGGAGGNGLQPCAVFERTGKCPFGSRCPYDHRSSTSSGPSSSSLTSSSSQPSSRTSPAARRHRSSIGLSSPVGGGGGRTSSTVHPEEPDAPSLEQLKAQAGAMADMNRQYELQSLNAALDQTAEDVAALDRRQGSGRGTSAEPSAVGRASSARSPHQLRPITEDRRSSFAIGNAGSGDAGTAARSPWNGAGTGKGGNNNPLDESFNIAGGGGAGGTLGLATTPSSSLDRDVGDRGRRREEYDFPQPEAQPQQPPSQQGQPNSNSNNNRVSRRVSASEQDILALVIKNQREPLRKVFGWTDGYVSPDASHLWSQSDTALHYAACYNSDLVADLLLELGANPNTRNAQGQTPIHFAAQYDSAAVLDKLLQASAKVHVRNVIDQTPLHYAARYNSVMALALLLHAKGDATVHNKSKQTPLHYAFKHDRSHIAALLLDVAGEEAATRLNSNDQVRRRCARVEGRRHAWGQAGTGWCSAMWKLSMFGQPRRFRNHHHHSTTPPLRPPPPPITTPTTPHGRQTPVDLGHQHKSVDTLAMYDEYVRSGFLPVTVEAALMRFRRQQNPSGLIDEANKVVEATRKELEASRKELAIVKEELQDAREDDRAHQRESELTIAKLKGKVEHLQGMLPRGEGGGGRERGGRASSFVSGAAVESRRCAHALQHSLTCAHSRMHTHARTPGTITCPLTR